MNMQTGSGDGCSPWPPRPWPETTGRPNARRPGFQTPCGETGACSDCRSPQRICRVTTIIERVPRATELSVCLSNEDLGY